MYRNTTLSLEEAWNAVALEERIELLERARAEGITAGGVFLLFLTSIAYGFDNIWILAVGAGGAIFIVQLFATHAWRRTKPQLILSYLAVRSMARRYAFGYKLEPLDIILIFRGRFRERFNSLEEEALYRQRESVDFDSRFEEEKEVWVCLLRGGVILLSERIGGARLEFVSGIGPEMTVRNATEAEGGDGHTVLITGVGVGSRGRTALISSNYRGALYVFERSLSRLVAEAAERRSRALNRERPETGT